MRQFTSSRIKNAGVIEGIWPNHSGGASLLVEGDTLEVSRDYLVKHEPVVGGYFIEYEDDGYLSFCPDDVFERNHTEFFGHDTTDAS